MCCSPIGPSASSSPRSLSGALPAPHMTAHTQRRGKTAAASASQRSAQMQPRQYRSGQPPPRPAAAGRPLPSPLWLPSFPHRGKTHASQCLKTRLPSMVKHRCMAPCAFALMAHNKSRRPQCRKQHRGHLDFMFYWDSRNICIIFCRCVRKGVLFRTGERFCFVIAYTLHIGSSVRKIKHLQQKFFISSRPVPF